ncbi:MAG: hypothetical protein MSA50_00780 [Veillonellaceae bacterium]|nr:hypothetical protein [Veillonellaceae bacterium]
MTDDAAQAKASITSLTTISEDTAKAVAIVQTQTDKTTEATNVSDCNKRLSDLSSIIQKQNEEARHFTID